MKILLIFKRWGLLDPDGVTECPSCKQWTYDTYGCYCKECRYSRD